MTILRKIAFYLVVRKDLPIFAANINIESTMVTPATKNILIPKIQDSLKSQPVKKAWLFGSYSRGEETPDSDVDILVTFDDGVTLLGYAHVYGILKNSLNKEVDLVEDGTLLPFAIPSAERDKILIYERKDS